MYNFEKLMKDHHYLKVHFIINQFFLWKVKFLKKSPFWQRIFALMVHRSDLFLFLCFRESSYLMFFADYFLLCVPKDFECNIILNPKLYLQDISINFFIEYFCVVLKANRLWLSSSSLPWQGTSLLVLTFFFFFTIKHMLFFFLSKNQTSTHPHNRSLKNWVLLKTSNHLVWKWNKMLNLYRNAK